MKLYHYLAIFKKETTKDCLFTYVYGVCMGTSPNNCQKTFICKYANEIIELLDQKFVLYQWHCYEANIPKLINIINQVQNSAQ